MTATFRRPALLAHCLRQFAQQSLGGVVCEQIVVSDGPDPIAQHQARQARARFLELPAPRGHAGAFAKDAGIVAAAGEYVCFWDDDNHYEPHALATMYATISGVDVGVVRARHRLRKRPGSVLIPRRWSGEFVPGDVDTMCVIVRTSLARQELWGDDNPHCGTDHRWLTRLRQHQPRIRFVPVCIGEHL